VLNGVEHVRSDVQAVDEQDHALALQRRRGAGSVLVPGRGRGGRLRDLRDERAWQGQRPVTSASCTRWARMNFARFPPRRGTDPGQIVAIATRTARSAGMEREHRLSPVPAWEEDVRRPFRRIDLARPAVLGNLVWRRAREPGSVVRAGFVSKGHSGHHLGRRRDGHPHHERIRLDRTGELRRPARGRENEDLTEEGVPVSQELLEAAR
jgi:hypothetical protein